MAQSPPLVPVRTRVSVEAPTAPSAPATPEGEASAVQADHRLYRELTDRFTVLAEQCARFSQEVYRRAETPPAPDVPAILRRNLKIARTVFGKWSIEILTTAYFNRSVGFEELKDALGGIPFPLLIVKLRQLEKMGLLQRDIAANETPETRYSLTHKGLMVGRLGEPVLLYLRLTDGWRSPPQGDEIPEGWDEKPIPTSAIEDRMRRGIDTDRALKAVRGMDDIRRKMSGRWGGAREVRMWRDLRG